MLELHFGKVLERFGSDFGSQKWCQNGSRLRFGALKASCWANILQNDMICCILLCPPLYVNVRFHCENTGVLNDFHFAFSLLNVILFPLKLYCKSFKMRPKIASESVFFGVQGAYSFRIVSKLNFEANFVSHGHPNGTRNAGQNWHANGLWEPQIDLGAPGLAKQRFWSQFGTTLTPLATNFGVILGQFATMNASRMDPLRVCWCSTCTIRASKISAHNSHGRARWRNTRACALDCVEEFIDKR